MKTAIHTTAKLLRENNIFTYDNDPHKYLCLNNLLNGEIITVVDYDIQGGKEIQHSESFRIDFFEKVKILQPTA